MQNFDEIYKCYFKDVYKYILSISRNETITEEVTQETFFKAMKNMNQFNGSCKLYVWLCQIAKNTYYTRYKKEQRFVSMPEDHILAADDIENRFFDEDTAKRLHILLHKMKEPYKEVFTLRVFGELSFAQIGELFGKSDSWARVIFYRAKSQLKEDVK